MTCARRVARLLFASALGLCAFSARAELVFFDGFEAGPAPVLRVLRDDRVATLEMDYNADNPWGQFWDMSGSPKDDAGFLVEWWPDSPTALESARAVTGNDSGG